MIAPSMCNHRRSIFVSGSRFAGPDSSGRDGVSLCPDCGQFHVYAEKNGQYIDVKFTLPTDELVEAAGRYRDYINQADENATLLPALEERG